MRKALLLSILVVTFGCKKASTPDSLETDAAAAATTDAAGADVEELAADETGGAGKKGEGTAGADGGESAAGGGADGGAAAAGGGADGGAAAAGGGVDGGAAGTTAGGGGTEPGKPGDPNPTQPGAPTGNVEFVVTSVAGGTGGDAVKAALEKNKQRFRGCYGKDPSNSGTLKLRATIAADGVVEKVDVMGGNLALGPVVQCTVATAKSTKVAGASAPATKASFDVKYSK